jgi:hypothetical protein
VSGDVSREAGRAGEQEWLRAFAAELGVEPPGDEAREQLLGLAGVAAHASERTAAPLSCWLAARAGLSPAEALAVATAVADRLAGDGAAPPEGV